MASPFTSVKSEKMIQINFCGVYYLTVLVYTKTTIHLSVRVVSGGETANTNCEAATNSPRLLAASPLIYVTWPLS